MQIMNLVPELRPIILAARQVRDERNTLAKYLPNTEVQSLSYRLGRRTKVDQTVPVRSFGAPATPIVRPGVVDVQGDLPAVTPIVNLTETDLNQEFVLAQQLQGQQVDWSPWVEQAAGLVSLATDNTYELMRGQALSTAVVSITAEDGNVHEVDFGVPADQKITVATKWSEDPTKVFADLGTAHEAFQDISGAQAGVALTSSKVYRIVLRALATMYPQSPVGTTELNAYLANQNLPTFETYDRTLRADDGTRARVYPEGSLTFLPAGDTVGRTELGVTQEAVQQVQNQVLTVAEAPGMTILTLGQDNPVERAVKGASIGLPVIQDHEDIVILSGLL